MSSVFETAAASARSAFYDVGGVPMTYARGTDTAELTAVPVTHGNRWSDAVSAGVWAGVRSWQIKAADLAALTEPRPQKGDTLTESDGIIWTVLSPDGGPVYKELDPEGMEFEVHTKLSSRS